MNHPEVDVVLVGLGWTGGILAKQLSEAGLNVVALERGGPRSTAEDFALPRIRDELRYGIRHGLMQDSARDTLTVRNHPQETALPMRRLGSFLPGEGVGGAGSHWNGLTWRWSDAEFRVRSLYEERHGKAFIPADMPLQDWGISYAELEPWYDRFERTAGVSGQAGNLQGRSVAGGNPFEAPRQRDYPLPPLHSGLAGQLYADAARQLGWHPFPRPSANASQAYTNPDGAQFGECQYCGFCERFGCEANAKGSPHFTVIPAALRQPSFTLRTHAWVTGVELDKADASVARGVRYVDTLTATEHYQPARLVVLSAYAINNVHLLLLSRIGQPYDPASGQGQIGRNYAYQGGVGAQLFFEDRQFNPFMGTGGNGIASDDFNANQGFDRGPVGAIGGVLLGAGHSNGRPIAYRPLPAGTPRWGSAWKAATAHWYGRAMGVGASLSVMPHRQNAYDLDPTYRNAFGQPLLRLTFDYQANDQRLAAFAAERVNEVARALKPSQWSPASTRASWSVVPYQTTHNTGGTPMGASPAASATNNFGQLWQVPNLFVTGASLFPHNAAYNPTGLVGALAYRTADAIKRRYFQAPGRLLNA